MCELRVGGEKGAQTVFPPSVHESGEEIRWESGSLAEPVPMDGAELEAGVRVAAAALAARYWPAKGKRHNTAQALGGALRRAGWGTPQIKLFVDAVVRAAGDPEPAGPRAAADAAAAVDAEPRLRHPEARRGARRQGGRRPRQVARPAERRLVRACPGPGQDDAGPAPDWPEPQPLPKGLLPVAPFTSDFLPFTLSAWVDDIAERMQCPPEFIAVTAIAALGAVLGRRIGVRPQQQTDWVEVASFWACVIGRPGWLKSPAMAEAMKPLLRLETEAQEKNEKARRSYEQELELWKLKKTARERAALGELKKDRNARPSFNEEKPEEPLAKRYVTNDSSYEALGQLLVANPTGILLFRDELVSLLKTLDREEYAAGARLHHDGLGRQERLLLRPHHPRPPAHQGGLRRPGRLHPARTHRRVSPARHLDERRQ